MIGFQQNLGIVRTNTRMSRAVGLAAIATVLGASLAQAACPSGYSGEMISKSVRTLQSDLMVGALSCGQRESYNTFVTEYRGQLVGFGKSLSQHFEVIHGGAHRSKLNSYVTQLANEASIRYATASTDYCETTDEIFKNLLVGKKKQLDSIALRYAVQVNPEVAAQVASVDGGDSCGTGGTLALSDSPAVVE